MGMDRENIGRATRSDLRDEAELWFARLLDADCPREARAAFERWCNADPRHAEAYRELELLWERSAAAARTPAVMAAAQRALRVEPEPRARRWLFPVMAAGLAALVAAIALPRWPSATPDAIGAAYATSPGEQRSVRLADGSSILLDTDTRLTVRYSARTRNVALLQGQAQFHVHGDHAWPFVVHAGHGTVTAVGTTFQVRADSDGIDVSLLEGKLAIATHAPDGAPQQVDITAGQGLHFDASGRITPPQPLDPQQAQGWTQGKLFVHDWRLPQLLAEMNRYSTTKLAIGDPSLQYIHISGVFRTHDQQTFLLMLRQGWAVQAKRVSDTRIVLQR
jgi:transmembrane sensor